MTQYWTDFSEYATGSAPSDWTARWDTTGTWTVEADAGATGGKVLRYVAAGDVRAGLSWDDVDGDAGRVDAEILVRWRANKDTEPRTGVVVVRGSGAAGSETGYGGHLKPTNSRMNSLNNGTLADLGSSVAFTWDVNTWYFIRFRTNGTTHQMKRWAGAIGDEPGAWTHEFSHSVITAAGWVGVLERVADITSEWDFIGVGTNGDTAPSAGAGATDLVIQDATHGHLAESPSLTQVHELAVAEASHGHAADQQALTQVHELAIQEGGHAHSADELGLTQDHNLITSGGLHSHAADNVTLDAGGVTTTEVISTEADNGRIQSRSSNYNTARSGGTRIVSETSSEMGQEKGAGDYFLFETFIAFDTSVIPDDDVIDSVTLRLFGGFDNSAQDFILEARLNAWGAPTLTSTDWVAGADLGTKTLLATFDTSAGWNLSDYNDLTDVALVANINKTGLTEMVVTSDRLRLGNTPATNVFESVGTFLTLEGQRPRLVIEHHAAVAGTNLIIQDASHAHSAESQSFTQVHNLTVQEASHGHLADQQALTQIHELAVQESGHNHTADSPSLAQVHNLIIAEALQGHTADNVVLVAEGDLAIADGLHSHSADILSLTQVHELVIQDAAHGHLAEALALVLDLGIQGALHGHSADNIVLMQLHLLVIADALHGHIADEVAVSSWAPIARRTGTATPRRELVGVSRRETTAVERRG